MKLLPKLLSFCNTNDTTCFIDKLFGVYYGGCSKSHDRRYANKRLSRRQADILFYRCLKRKIPKKNKPKKFFFSVLFLGFYFFVRTFGWFFYRAS